MSTIVAFNLIALAGLIVALSLWGVVTPRVIVTFVRSFMHRPMAIWVAIGIRVLLALLLWLAAPLSYTPTLFMLLAAIALLAALVLAVAGSDRVTKMIDHISTWPQQRIRLLCLFGVVFGLFLIWSLSPVWITH
ncbi:hypothetical protein FM042_00840 [Aliidiomarina halalkaliphila]|uniref:Uncharacterized protein n=1 Tax=Aliidiomarina halalkaliphila TaxID=2593535 RepID=A0A552X4B8_9GAMM|nr:hypothetical protein [Aliidiomarina halalkaliphila]TRW49443.1 hypothetical protein FM042_00840 [Aliidiomarina halalkaliphila]